MDLDSLISLFFIFIFFVLPAILNRRKRQAEKNKSPGAPATPRSAETRKKKPSILDQISLKIQQTVQELEEQARKQAGGKEGESKKKAGTKPADIWELLADKKPASKAPRTDDGRTPLSRTDTSGPVPPSSDAGKSHTIRMEKAPKTGPLIPPDEGLEEKAAQRQRIREQERRKTKPERPSKRPAVCRRPRRYGWNERPGLQQAVIWSEILGRPVGLRQESSSGTGSHSM